MRKTIQITYPGNTIKELEVTIDFEDDISPEVNAISDLTVTRGDEIQAIQLSATDNIGVEEISIE